MPLRVGIDDAEIASVALFAPLPWFARLDMLPFLLFYATAAALFCMRPAGDVVAVLFAAIAASAHALAFLLGEWSVDMQCWLAYAPLRVLPNAEHGEQRNTRRVVVKVVPAHAMLPKQVCDVRVETPRELQVEAKQNDVVMLSFAYQNRTFCLRDDRKAVHAHLARFRPLEYPTQFPLREYVASTGLVDDADLARAMTKWRDNDFDIPMPGFGVLLKEQLVAPFFVFQFFCMLLWCLDEYVYYSLLTLAMIVLFECTVVKQRQRNMASLNDMRRTPQRVLVYRSRAWSATWCDKLVPGDICSIGPQHPDFDGDSQQSIVPCDLLLLCGSCVVNEAMLSGESIPLRKEGISMGMEDSELSEMLCIDEGTSLKHKKHVLFGGTKILQHVRNAPSGDSRVPAPPDMGCTAFVLRTGFGTTQGSLMRTILHSSQRVTAGNSEAMWFIALLLVFAVAASGFVLQQGLQDPSRNRFKLLLHCIMIVTSVVPPELPMELSLAVTNSLVALTKFNIYCTEPFRIPLAGRVDICCFDKTGTLTSDELKVRGIAGLNAKATPKDGGCSDYDVIAPEQLPLDTALVMAGCQSLVLLDGQAMGDPLEATALRSIRWTLGFSGTTGDDASIEPSFASIHRGIVQQVNILHRFSFSSELKRMSTIVSIVKADNEEHDEVRVVTKGAPEVLDPLLSNKPAEYKQTYRYFASKGCRVLALGYRVLPAQMSLAEIRLQRRRDIETDLLFAGFLVLDCPLKRGSQRIVRDLTMAKHKVAMVTGDNVLTAYDVSRQVGICTRDAKQTLVLHASQNTRGSAVEWRPVDDQVAMLTNDQTAFHANDVSALSAEFDLCVTGDALTALQKYCESASQGQGDESASIEGYFSLLQQIAVNVRVFARMSPQQKEHVIMAMNRAGKTTVMCGDGTNDVGALKRAHVGVSIVNRPDPETGRESLVNHLSSKHATKLERQLRALQEEDEASGPVRLGDASIASPFTSKGSSIRVVKQLVRQGRCTLVTTIQMYKILGINCLITAYHLSSLFVMGVKNGDQQLTIEGLCIAAFFLFLSWAKPAKRLSKERPPSRVFCLPVLVSIVGQSLIHLLFLAGAVYTARPYIDYADPSMHPDGPFNPNVINSIMFLQSFIMQVNTFVANYKGHPFMQRFWDHKILNRCALGAYAVAIIAALELFPPLNEVLELVPMPNPQVQWTLVGLMVGDSCATLGLEFIIERATTGWF